jgi:5-methyltetrahydrofolate--homocysteine methyltransferase
MRNPFVDALASGQVLLMDGAMGTELQKAGAKPGECFEGWNLTHPDRVRSIHQAYADAGAKVLLTNTFQANPVQLQRHGLLAQASEICGSAVALARSFAKDHWVLASIGPMPEKPGDADFPRREPLLHMASFLTGADAILLETCSDWSAWQAAQWLHEALPSSPLLLSFALHKKNGQLQTRDEHVPGDFAEPLRSHPLSGLGLNCGVDQGISEMSKIIRHWRSFTDLALFARPNAGTPEQVDGRWIYPHSPEEMAEGLPELLRAGVAMVGGCCGTTPDHIAAIRGSLRSGRQDGY